MEKEQKKGQDELKQCCSACSIGERCLKVKAWEKEVEERIEDYVPTPLDLLEGLPNEEEEQRREAGGWVTLITARTHSKTGQVIQAPLREAMGPGGPTRLKGPFNMGDLDAWKQVVKSYQGDPSGVGKRFELIVKNQDPDWKDIDLMLDAMTETEKQLVIETARTHMQAQITAGVMAGGVDQYVPHDNPNWNPNDNAHY